MLLFVVLRATDPRGLCPWNRCECNFRWPLFFGLIFRIEESEKEFEWPRCDGRESSSFLRKLRPPIERQPRKCARRDSPGGEPLIRDIRSTHGDWKELDSTHRGFPHTGTRARATLWSQALLFTLALLTDDGGDTDSATTHRLTALSDTQVEIHPKSTKRIG